MAQTSASSSVFRQRFQTALARLNAGETAAAEAECRALLRQAPDDPAVLQLDATIALRSGHAARAQASIHRSLRLRPNHVPSLLVAARAAVALGAGHDALPPLRLAVSHAPDLAEAAFLLCQTLLDLGHPSLDDAIADAARRHGDRAGEWQGLGYALQERQRHGLALAAFSRAVAADPKLAASHLARGLLLREAGHPTEADFALRRALALHPTASSAWFALGLTCQDLGDEAEAAVAYREALRHRDDFAEAAVNLGISQQRLGNMAAAIDAYRQAIRIRPDTFGRIAQAVTASSTGALWLDPLALRRLLGA